MTKDTLDILRELQTALDGLKTIQRDLSALPPDMADFDKTVKVAEKHIQELDKHIEQARARIESCDKEQKQAIKAEEWARKDLKASTHKVQYTAAMRALEEKERQLEYAQRAAKEYTATLQLLETERESQLAIRCEAKKQFDELHEIFLSEHENQVVGKERLTRQIAELESKLDQTTLAKFNRLLQGRNGRAVVPVENDTCKGCNTKLRMPLVYKLRAEGTITCESCQRILYI